MPRKKNPEPVPAPPIAPIPDFARGAEGMAHCRSVTIRRAKAGPIFRDVVFERDLAQDATGAAWPGSLSLYRSAVVAAIAGSGNPTVNAILGLDVALSTLSLAPVVNGAPEHARKWEGQGVLRWLRLRASEDTARLLWCFRCHAPAGQGTVFDEFLSSTVAIASTPAQQELLQPKEPPAPRLVESLEDEDEDEDEDDIPEAS